MLRKANVSHQCVTFVGRQRIQIVLSQIFDIDFKIYFHAIAVGVLSQQVRKWSIRHDSFLASCEDGQNDLASAICFESFCQVVSKSAVQKK